MLQAASGAGRQGLLRVPGALHRGQRQRPTTLTQVVHHRHLVRIEVGTGSAAGAEMVLGDVPDVPKPRHGADAQERRAAAVT